MRKVVRAQTDTWNKLLKAILVDDRKKVARLLADDPFLARRTDEKGRFVVPRSLAPSSVPVIDSGKNGVTHWFYRGDTALHLCAAAHRVELARMLLRRGADVNARNFREGTPLHYACDARPQSRSSWKPARQSQMISLLAKHGADLDARDKGGITPLHDC